MPRSLIFIGVGALGFLVQITALWALLSIGHWRWLPATTVAVELAIIHNFLWHRRWTWRDRAAAAGAFVRFNMSTGITSLAGNAALMAVFVGLLGMPAIPANVLAVATMSAANFFAADRWVFRVRLKPDATYTECVVCALALIVIPVAIRAETRVGPNDRPETVEAWDRYIVATEARLEGTRMSTAPDPRPTGSDPIAASGQSIGVPSGTISDWRGSVFIPRVTLDRLLDLLKHPGTPPPQEDVLSSRVLSRTADSLHVSIRLVRHAIVTVSYETEHEMQFRRWTPTLATARSVATRIDEVGGSDHGFLWRLNSYWRYRELDGGVFVDLESLTLSRDVPALIRPIAAPLVHRIARESMVRTLDALRRWVTRDSLRPPPAGGVTEESSVPATAPADGTPR
jgi:putative flippase GtrA